MLLCKLQSIIMLHKPMNLFYTNPRSLQVARQAISRLLLVMLGSSTSAKTSDGSITSHVNKSAASHARRSSVKAGAANSTPKTRAITQAACTEGRGRAGDDKRVVALAGSTAQHAALQRTHAAQANGSTRILGILPGTPPR